MGWACGLPAFAIEWTLGSRKSFVFISVTQRDKMLLGTQISHAFQLQRNSAHFLTEPNSHLPFQEIQKCEKKSQQLSLRETTATILQIGNMSFFLWAICSTDIDKSWVDKSKISYMICSTPPQPALCNASSAYRYRHSLLCTFIKPCLTFDQNIQVLIWAGLWGLSHPCIFRTILIKLIWLAGPQFLSLTAPCIFCTRIIYITVFL